MENYKNLESIFDETNADLINDSSDYTDTLFTFDFGAAIKMLKSGKLVRRRGWNGKGMFLWLKPATKIKAEWCKDQVLRKVIEDNGGEMDSLGTICMKTADNKILTGWLASQTDMLSEDWEVLSQDLFDWEKSLTEDDFMDFNVVDEMNDKSIETENKLYEYIGSKIEEDAKDLMENLNIPSLTEDEKEIVERMFGVTGKKEENNA